MTRLALALMLAGASWISSFAQEKPVPKDSVRFSIAGCARGRVFTVERHPEHETRSPEIELGRKLRLEGPKKLLEEIKANERSMVEITGLMKQADVRPPGIGLAGGRVRVAPVEPMGRSVGRDPGIEQSIIDVEAWRLLNKSCPAS
jgi:hypothetical protein